MKKVFFFDVDGTLLPLNQDNVTKKTIHAINELQKNGHEVFIATGKSIQHAGWVGDDLNVKNFIATNGQVMVIDGVVQYEKHFTKDDMKIWEELTKKTGMILGFQGTYESGIFKGKEELEVKAKKFFDDVTIPYPDYIDTIPTDYKVGQMWIVGDLEHVDTDEELYRIVKWPHTGADVLPVGASKAYGIKYYLENIDNEVETYGFGDGFNDIEMFHHVNNAIAMGNANSTVKSHADVVIKASEDDGVYHYLLEQGLIGAYNE